VTRGTAPRIIQPLDDPRKNPDVVDELVDTSTWQYTVISVRSEPDGERLVIAYPDEETLRDLIAAPGIVALGYTSRADVLKNIDRCVKTTASLKRGVKTASLVGSPRESKATGESQILEDKMWMRCCAACKRVLRKASLAHHVRCECGWE
jgi:hypothetical protein